MRLKTQPEHSYKRTISKNMLWIPLLFPNQLWLHDKPDLFLPKLLVKCLQSYSFSRGLWTVCKVFIKYCCDAGIALNAAVQWGFGWIFVIWISGFYSVENHRYRCWFPPHPRLSCNTSSNHGKYCKLVQFIDFTVQCVIHYHLSPNGCSVLSAINAWLQCVIRYHVTAVRYPLSPDCP